MLKGSCSSLFFTFFFNPFLSPVQSIPQTSDGCGKTWLGVDPQAFLVLILFWTSPFSDGLVYPPSIPLCSRVLRDSVMFYGTPPSFLHIPKSLSKTKKARSFNRITVQPSPGNKSYNRQARYHTLQALSCLS